MQGCAHKVSCWYTGLILGLALIALPASASGVEFSLTQGQWTQTNLPDLPGRLVKGEFALRPAWYTGLSVAYPLWSSRGGWRIEGEGRLLQHYGGQLHLETAAAIVLRSPCWSVGSWCWRGGVGEGGSHAWSDPAMEMGGGGIVGIDTRRYQNYLLFELALSPQPSRWQLLSQIHHRSGIYGLISPRRTGSNYLAIGVRWRP